LNLDMAERTGCLVLSSLWSYVAGQGLVMISIHANTGNFFQSRDSHHL